jgi:hypothetical protein
MNAENLLRSFGILIGLTVLGCAATPEPMPRSVPAQLTLAPGCPYSNVYVAVSTKGEERDTKLAERVRVTYAESLGAQGFSVVTLPEEAYWSAFSLVHLSNPVDATFAWSVYMMATQDLRGRVQTPIRFAAAEDDVSDLSGFMLLREIHLLELDAQVRRAAEDTAVALAPHTARMCMAWTTEPMDDLAPSFHQVRGADDLIEKLRDELAKEILRVRREQQQRSLEVGLEPSS